MEVLVIERHAKNLLYSRILDDKEEYRSGGHGGEAIEMISRKSIQLVPLVTDLS